MTATTNGQKDIIIKIVKDFTTDYNPSNLANELSMTRVGTFKALKELEKKGLVKGRNLGKARFYKIDLTDEYARKNVELLVMEQSKAYQRWIDEFSPLYEYVKIAVLFGSITRKEETAKDVDLLLVFDAKNNNKINEFIKNKNQILLKKVHPIKQTKEDLIKNIKKKDKVILSALSEGIILYGYEELVGVIKNVTSKE